MLLAGVTIAQPVGPVAVQSRPVPFTILHWNDFHAQNAPLVLADTNRLQRGNMYEVGGAAALHGYIEDLRRSYGDVAVLCAGDDVQGTPISTLTFGRSQIELMNHISPTAFALGNHEFDYGMDTLRANIARATFPILCSNVVDLATGKPLGRPFLLKKIQKVTAGFIGLAPPDLADLTLASNLRGCRIMNVDSAINRSIKEMRAAGAPNILVVVSHMGLGQDTLLAMRRKDIDVIVGGHDHIALATPIKKNGTLIVEAGSRGQFLGELDLLVNVQNNSVASSSSALIETRVDGTTPDPFTQRIVDSLESIVNKKLGSVIGNLPVPWDRSFGQRVESNLGDFECDAMRSAAHTDIAFQNAGGMRKDLGAGPIKERDIWEINPFENTLVVFSINGSQLKPMMEWQTSVAPKDFLQVSGMRYTYNSTSPRGHRIRALKVNGKPIDKSSTYTICTNNFVGTHLRLFFNVADSSVHVRDTGQLDRDAIIEYLKEHKKFVTVPEGRIVDVGSTLK